MKDNTRGFTLVEVMVGAVLLTMVLGGGLAALIQGNRLIEEARDMTRVSQILQSEIEALRTMNWADLQAAPSGKVERPLSGTFAQKFTGKYTVFREIAAFNDGQKSVEITVEWTGPQNRKHSKNHYTRISRGGLNDYYYRTF